jgi:predicted metal-dependent phosphoesterase TrpH
LLKVDLHLHTVYSRDSLASLEAVIEACQKRGLGAIAVTDHGTIAGALALRAVAPFPVIVGEEIKTSRGELLAYFLEEGIPQGLPPQEVITRIRAQGGVVGVPHPLDRVRREAMGLSALLEIIDQVDALEVFNARTVFAADNRRAEDLAQERGLLRLAGSDAHTAYEIGRAYVEMPPFEDRAGFLRSLAQGRVVGHLTPPWIHFTSTWARLRKRLRSLR